MGIKFHGLSDVLDDMEKEVNRALTKVIVATFNNVVALSPVDTGQYRNAHHISQGSPSFAMSGAKGIKIAAGDYRPIYIQNNLPYVLRIENGWSGQAPTGVYGNAVNSTMASLG